MCISRVLLLILLPFLPVKTPVYRRSVKIVIMEGNNTTGLYEHIWSELIPSVRVFLTSVVLFLIIALLIMLVIIAYMKILRTIWPRFPPVNRQTSSIELREFNADTGSSNGTERDQTDRKVRFRGSDSQTEGDRGTRTPSPTNYAQIQPATSLDGQSADPFTPVRPAAPSPTTSTPSNSNLSQGPSDSPALSPLNPFSANYTPSASQRPMSSSSFTRAEITPQSPSMINQSGSFSQRKAKTPDTFSGKSDLEDWLRHFEIISRWNGWNEEEMGSSLASSLRGNAQQVLRDLPAAEMENFDSIVYALKRRFDPEEREGSHKDHFKTRIKKKDESISEYGFALSRLAISAYPRMSQKDREEIVIDQFINGLPFWDLQKHVKFGKPENIDQALALATEYESFDGRFQGQKPEDHSERPVRVIDKKMEDEIGEEPEVSVGEEEDSDKSIVIETDDEEEGVGESYQTLGVPIVSELSESESSGTDCMDEEEGDKDVLKNDEKRKDDVKVKDVEEVGVVEDTVVVKNNVVGKGQVNSEEQSDGKEKEEEGYDLQMGDLS